MTVVQLDRQLVERIALRLQPEQGRVLGGCEHAGCEELHGLGHRFCPRHRVERRQESRRRYNETRRRAA